MNVEYMTKTLIENYIMYNRVIIYFIFLINKTNI